MDYLGNHLLTNNLLMDPMKDLRHVWDYENNSFFKSSAMFLKHCRVSVGFMHFEIFVCCVKLITHMVTSCKNLKWCNHQERRIGICSYDIMSEHI